MAVSYYKYGPMQENYDSYKCLDSLANLKKRIEKYEETGNTEFLVDVANFAMIEFMYPSIKGAKFKRTDGDGEETCKMVGFSVQEMRDFK